MPNDSQKHRRVRFPYSKSGNLSSRLVLFVVVLVGFAFAPGCGSGSDASVAPAELVDARAGRSANNRSASETRQPSTGQAVSLLFFGDSITAGYGLAREDEAYPYVFERIAAEKGIAANVTSAGNSGETTAGGVRRIDWVLKSEYDIVIIELGGNDGLRGVPVPTVSANLQTIITKVRSISPGSRIVIAGMRLPPSLGSGYVSSFESVFAEVASKNDADLIPFILEGVAGDPSLNQIDGIHPTAAGHAVIAERVFQQLEPLLLREASTTN